MSDNDTPHVWKVGDLAYGCGYGCAGEPATVLQVFSNGKLKITSTLAFNWRTRILPEQAYPTEAAAIQAAIARLDEEIARLTEDRAKHAAQLAQLVPPALPESTP